MLDLEILDITTLKKGFVCFGLFLGTFFSSLTLNAMRLPLFSQ